MEGNIPLFITKYTNSTEDMNFLAMDLELYPFLEYEGWKKMALLAYMLATCAIEIFTKVLLYRFSKTVNILERPITIIFIVDQTVQGIGFVVSTLVWTIVLPTGIPIVKLTGSMEVG